MGEIVGFERPRLVSRSKRGSGTFSLTIGSSSEYDDTSIECLSLWMKGRIPFTLFVCGISCLIYGQSIQLENLTADKKESKEVYLGDRKRVRLVHGEGSPRTPGRVRLRLNN